MLIPLPDLAAVAVSCVAWVLIGLVTGWFLHRRSIASLEHDGWLTRPRRFEQDGRWYQRNLRIRRWKDRLPEKGDLFPDGFSKRHLIDRSTPHLERFVAETRRAELVHWSNMAAGPLFLIWCSPLLGACMIAFGVIAHLPFIVIQRYNRARLLVVLRRRAARSS
ncbi:MAG: glycosyl-4,4'-diaponeurosporenoate acyltransferase [Microthrixaceae bacterium]